MSRLTCKYDGINALRELCTFDRESDIEADDCQSCEEYCKRHCDCSCKDCAMQKAFDKLAEYEQLEEQGLLLKLPCKVGDIIYEIACIYDEYEVVEMLVKEILLEDKDVYFYITNTDKDSDYDNSISITEFGKDLFLTKEEAEAAKERLYEINNS